MRVLDKKINAYFSENAILLHLFQHCLGIDQNTIPPCLCWISPYMPLISKHSLVEQVEEENRLTQVHLENGR